MSYETLDIAIQALVASNAQLVSSVNEVRVGVEGVAEAAEGSKNAAGVSAQEAADTAAGLTASVNALLADKQDSASLGSAAFADASSFATAAQGLLAENAQPKEVDKGLSEENYTLAEKDKLVGIASEATKNRDDSENADKLHPHTIAQVTGLSDRLDSIDALIGDVESALILINGEP